MFIVFSINILLLLYQCSNAVINLHEIFQHEQIVRCSYNLPLVETRYLNRFETPLANQHRHGAEERFVELWLVQTRDHSSSRGSGGTMKSRLSSELDDSDSDLDDGETNVSPKEEG